MSAQQFGRNGGWLKDSAVSADESPAVKPVRAKVRVGLVAGVVLMLLIGGAGTLLWQNLPSHTEGSPPDARPISPEELKQVQDKAERGDSVAQNQLGEFYLYGRRVRADPKSAAVWFEKSAAQGNATAQLNLGMLLDAGQGVSVDYAKAIEWYRKAAAQNSYAAQYNLAAMYAEGRGVSRDDRESTRWLTLAADQGYGLAEFSLGHRYIKGAGVGVDLVEAYKWLTLASAARISDAAAALDEIKEKMSAQDIADGKRRASAFVPKRISVVTP